jgi:hypothetical protein
MPRAPAKIRKRYIEGVSEVLDFQIEETLLHGVYRVFGPPSMFKTVACWRHAWAKWRDLVLPKVLEHRPGTRPFAMYAIGEIPARELRMPLPASHRFWSLTLPGTGVTHYLNVPEPYIENEADHLYRLGVIDSDERKRHRAWQREIETHGGRADTYTLEAGLYE